MLLSTNIHFYFSFTPRYSSLFSLFFMTFSSPLPLFLNHLILKFLLPFLYFCFFLPITFLINFKGILIFPYHPRELSFFFLVFCHLFFHFLPLVTSLIKGTLLSSSYPLFSFFPLLLALFPQASIFFHLLFVLSGFFPSLFPFPSLSANLPHYAFFCSFPSRGLPFLPNQFPPPVSFLFLVSPPF